MNTNPIGMGRLGHFLKQNSEDHWMNDEYDYQTIKVHTLWPLLSPLIKKYINSSSCHPVMQIHFNHNAQMKNWHPPNVISWFMLLQYNQKGLISGWCHWLNMDMTMLVRLHYSLCLFIFIWQSSSVESVVAGMPVGAGSLTARKKPSYCIHL